MKTLICGATGFIGGALAQVVEGARALPGRAVIDLRNPFACEQVVAGMELVYLCAGVTGGSGALAADPLQFVTPNLLIHANMFDACRRAGVKKVVCLSSTTGYPETDLPMDESDYFRGEPHPAYFAPGHTRRFIERLGAMYPELEVVYLRPSVVYGPGDDFDPATSHVIPALVRKVSERRDPIVIWGDGTQWRDAVHVSDVVRALVLAADAPAGAYNLASGGGMTIEEIFRTLTEHARWSGAWHYDTSKPSMLAKRVLVIEKAKRVMGWEPTITMDWGLRDTLDWYIRVPKCA